LHFVLWSALVRPLSQEFKFIAGELKTSIIQFACIQIPIFIPANGFKFD